MTKYKVTRYAGESQPCAIADPAGCFYSTGEVDRVIAELKGMASILDSTISEQDNTIQELASLIKDMTAWFDHFNPYPDLCVQDLISRGAKFAVHTLPGIEVPGGTPLPY